MLCCLVLLTFSQTPLSTSTNIPCISNGFFRNLRKTSLLTLAVMDEIFPTSVLCTQDSLPRIRYPRFIVQQSWIFWFVIAQCLALCTHDIRVLPHSKYWVSGIIQDIYQGLHLPEDCARKHGVLSEWHRPVIGHEDAGPQPVPHRIQARHCGRHPHNLQTQKS